MNDRYVDLSDAELEDAYERALRDEDEASRAHRDAAGRVGELATEAVRRRSQPTQLERIASGELRLTHGPGCALCAAGRPGTDHALGDS